MTTVQTYTPKHYGTSDEDARLLPTDDDTAMLTVPGAYLVCAVDGSAWATSSYLTADGINTLAVPFHQLSDEARRMIDRAESMARVTGSVSSTHIETNGSASYAGRWSR